MQNKKNRELYLFCDDRNKIACDQESWVIHKEREMAIWCDMQSPIRVIIHMGHPANLPIPLELCYKEEKLCKQEAECQIGTNHYGTADSEFLVEHIWIYCLSQYSEPKEKKMLTQVLKLGYSDDNPPQSTLDVLVS